MKKENDKEDAKAEGEDTVLDKDFGVRVMGDEEGVCVAPRRIGGRKKCSRVFSSFSFPFPFSLSRSLGKKVKDDALVLFLSEEEEEVNEREAGSEKLFFLSTFLSF